MYSNNADCHYGDCYYAECRSTTDSVYLIIENSRIFRTNHLNEFVPVDIRLEGLLVKFPYVQDVADPDASDGHALQGDQPTKVVDLGKYVSKIVMYGDVSHK